ncbi:MAG: hypothetical protein Q9165_006346 [Trypethelium subeluteriae]
MRSLVCLLLVVVFANAQSVLDVLSSQSNLSQVRLLIASLPQFSEQLNASNVFTFLAPSDNAIATWLNSSSPSNDSIEATLRYHLVFPTITSADVREQPAFYPTALNDTAFTNVTIGIHGQVLEAVYNDGIVFISGNKTESRIETKDLVGTGGIVQIIDSVLSIPTDFLTEATAAELNVLISLLSDDDFTIAEQYKTLPNTTILAPNSTAALVSADSNAFYNIYSENHSALNELFEYHVMDGLWYSPDFNGTSLKTKEGTDVLVTLDDQGDIWINQAKITGKDYLIANGVMHVIDE